MGGAVLLQFEVDECVDHRVEHTMDDVFGDAFLDGQPSKPGHHHRAAIGCLHGVLIGFVARGLFDELLAYGQEFDDLLVDLVDM